MGFLIEDIRHPSGRTFRKLFQNSSLDFGRRSFYLESQAFKNPTLNYLLDH